MNEIIYKLWLTGDKLMPEIHLLEHRFLYSARGPFTKNKDIIQNIKETGGSRHIYQNEFDKCCFQHDMIYADFKDLTIRKVFHDVLSDKAFDIFILDLLQRYTSF